MRHILITTLLVLTCSVQAQFFQFSQRHFTPQRVNPATVGSSNYFHSMLNFRNQTTAGGFSLISTALDLAYPISWGGTRRGGVGVYLLDDRAGTQGIFNIQEVGFSTGISIPTDEYSSFNLGIGMGYQRKAFDISGLTTGAQFIPDRGFDLGLANGESFGEVNTNFLRWNAGIYWRKEDKNEVLKSYVGISAFDLNEPDESLVTTDESLLPMTLVAEAGLSVHQTRDAVLYAEAFAFGADENYSLQAGVMWNKEMQRDQNLQLRARYSTEHFVMLGATIQKDNFLVGASYDIALGGTSAANQSAFEVGIGWRMFVEPKGRKRNKKKKGESELRTRPQAELKLDSLAQEKPEPELVEPDTVVTTPQVEPEPEPTETELRIGQPVSEKKVVDTYEVRLPFRFNSAELSQAFTEFLDDVVLRLQNDPNLMVEVIGHTDSIGDEDVNLRISRARAKSVADYLISQGIDPSRIVTDGKGEALPISSNETAQGRALNRRVEIKILEKQ